MAAESRRRDLVQEITLQVVRQLSPPLVTNGVSFVLEKIQSVNWKKKYLLWSVLGVIVGVFIAIGIQKFNKQNNRMHSERIKDLKKDLINNVYGQPIARRIVFDAINAHFKDESPKIPLTLVLYGGTGTGKTHMATVVARSFLSFSCLVKFKGTEFWGGPEMLLQYQKEVSSNITEIVRKCEHSLIVIDEAQSVPPGVLLAIKPMLGFDDAGRNIFGGAMFMFLTTSGSSKIKEVMLSTNHKDKQRYMFTIEDFKHIPNSDDNSVLPRDWYDEGIIGAYVPFLPMKKEHVQNCAQAELSRRGIIDSDPESIANRQLYDADGFANYGCKQVFSDVNLNLRVSKTD